MFGDSFLLSGPNGLKLDGADQVVATVTGLEAGQYSFRLTVCDQQGATDSALLSVRVLQSKRWFSSGSAADVITGQ